eukprot:1316068-Alexandrium_andersonii.AAC.1
MSRSTSHRRCLIRSQCAGLLAVLWLNTARLFAGVFVGGLGRGASKRDLTCAITWRRRGRRSAIAQAGPAYRAGWRFCPRRSRAHL